MNIDNYNGIGSAGYNGSIGAQNKKSAYDGNKKYPSASAMLKKIQAISFAMVETELYLDSHPECSVALEHYEHLANEYRELVSIYENEVAPIRHEGAIGEKWTWVSNPWPWHNEEV